MHAKVSNIQPKKSPIPLIQRKEGQPWIEWATTLLAHTRYEINLTPEEWSQEYGMPVMPTYMQTLKSQEMRLANEMSRHYIREDGGWADAQEALASWLIFCAAFSLPPAWAGISFYRPHRTGERKIDGGFVRFIPTEPDIFTFEGRLSQRVGRPNGLAIVNQYIINREVIQRGIRTILAGKTALLEERVVEIKTWLSDTTQPLEPHIADQIVQVGLFGEVIY